MKKQKTDRCPGCSRHCPVNALRCKRGRAYFAEKLNESPDIKRKKWKKTLCPDGLIFKLLTVSRLIKKSLKSGALTEEQLLALLTTEEQTLLAALMNRLLPLLDADAKNIPESVSVGSARGIYEPDQ